MAERLQQQPPAEDVGVKHIDLTVQLGTRDGTLMADPKMVNCYTEVTEVGLVCKKRAGLVVVKSPPAGAPQGQYSHKQLPYSIVGDAVYATLGATTHALPGVTHPGLRCSVLSDITNGVSLVATARQLWVTDAAGLPIRVTDVNYPAITVPGLAYLEGSFYVMEEGGVVRSSQLETPTSWPALNFIGSDAAMGKAVGLCRHLNYVAAFYDSGVQLFYNAGNPTGSVLLPLGNGNWRIGCAAGWSLEALNDETFFMSKTGPGKLSVHKLSGVSCSRVSNPYIERVLARSDTNLASVCSVHTDGHSFYVITLPSQGLSLVYDTVLDHWSVWTSTAAGVEGHFRGVNAITQGDVCYLQDDVTGATLRLDEGVYTDHTGAISMRVVTPARDWGTLKRKFMPAVFLICDTVEAIVYLRYSDKDYASPSAWREIQLGTARKMALRMGSSVRRSWELLFTADAPFRGFTIQIEIERGAD